MQNIATVVSQFVFALAALLAHPKTPKLARTFFKDAAVEFINHSKGGFPPGETLEAGLLRAFGVKATLPKGDDATAKGARLESPSPYAPEVENRRADYAQLAEALVSMTRLECDCLPNMLDIEGPDANINKRHLSGAIDAHLYALHMGLNWWDARTLRRFYVEHRLWADQMEWELKQNAARHAA